MFADTPFGKLGNQQPVIVQQQQQQQTPVRGENAGIVTVLLIFGTVWFLLVELLFVLYYLQ